MLTVMVDYSRFLAFFKERVLSLVDHSLKMVVSKLDMVADVVDTVVV